MMQLQPELSPRHQLVLNTIVRTYIHSGKPVPSRTVARLSGTGLSPASIRNVMQELAELGYLDQPHTSAGRVPTTKAFRHYVRSLKVSKLSRAQLQKLEAELSKAQSLDERLERTTHVLTQWTQNVSVAAAIPDRAQRLDKVDLVSLSGNRILVIISTLDRLIRTKLVTVDTPLSQDELDKLRNFLNEQFSGWELVRIKQALEARLREQSALYDTLMRKLMELTSHGLLEIDLSPEVHLEGMAYLAAFDWNLTREHLKALLRAVEEKRRLLTLLDRLMDPSADSLTVRVGLDDVNPLMKELSLVGISVLLPGGIYARFAVIGPLRMQYEKTMSTVYSLAEVFKSLAV